jgi:transposase-like protein
MPRGVWPAQGMPSEVPDRPEGHNVGRPSKFTAENRAAVLEALQVGASRNEAARIARIGPTTLKRWIDEGKKGSESSPKAKFLTDVEQAEAAPKMRALGVVYRAMEDRPDLAWKFIERRVEGYEQPVAQPAAIASGPVNIMLSFTDTPRPVLSEVIDVGSGDPTPPEPAELPARATPKSTRSRKKS